MRQKLTRWHFFQCEMTCPIWDTRRLQIDPQTSEREYKRLRDMLQLSYIEPFYIFRRFILRTLQIHPKSNSSRWRWWWRDEQRMNFELKGRCWHCCCYVRCAEDSGGYCCCCCLCFIHFLRVAIVNPAVTPESESEQDGRKINVNIKLGIKYVWQMAWKKS